MIFRPLLLHTPSRHNKPFPGSLIKVRPLNIFLSCLNFFSLFSTLLPLFFLTAPSHFWWTSGSAILGTMLSNFLHSSVLFPFFNFCFYNWHLFSSEVMASIFSRVNGVCKSNIYNNSFINIWKTTALILYNRYYEKFNICKKWWNKRNKC